MSDHVLLVGSIFAKNLAFNFLYINLVIMYKQVHFM
jgi:hypothetical protein